MLQADFTQGEEPNFFLRSGATRLLLDAALYPLPVHRTPLHGARSGAISIGVATVPAAAAPPPGRPVKSRVFVAPPVRHSSVRAPEDQAAGLSPQKRRTPLRRLVRVVAGPLVLDGAPHLLGPLPVLVLASACRVRLRGRLFGLVR